MGMKKIILLLVGIFMTMMCLGGIFTLSILLQYADFQQGKAVVIIIFLLMITGFGLTAFKCFKSAFNKEKVSHNSNTTNIPAAEMFAQPTSEIHLERNAVSLSSIPEKEFEEPQRITPEYIETHNMIYRVDGKPITDEEVPYLIQAGYEEAIEQEKVNPNVKFHRTEREEDLCVQFMINHGNEIQKHTDSFEDLCRLAYAENDLNEKIKFLQKTITVYEKERKWFYRSKGGTIYFQDYYEHQHNSKNNDFSYIDSVKDFLNYNLYKRDYIIPEIIQTITSSGRIIQKDIYEHFPDISKSVMQRTIRELENANLIVRTKKGNSYFLSLSN